MRRMMVAGVALLVPIVALAQPTEKNSGFISKATHAYQTLFTKTVRISLDSIAPGSGLPIGVGFKPKPWRSATIFKFVEARASLSQNKYWELDGNAAFQGVLTREWRIEPYVRLRQMKRLNYFGIGDETSRTNRSTFSMLDRRAGAYGYVRPVGWLALGGRAEGFWPRTSSGEDPDAPSIESRFTPSERPGFEDATNYIYFGGFLNLNYPYVRGEAPRRGGDYGLSVGSYRDVSGTGLSFTRFEVEGRERFPVFGIDRVLTLHGRLSASSNAVPFYAMDTLGGADNLRGFSESAIGGDEATSTLRSFESFRFRDRTTALLQADFRQRVWSQIFATVFVDAGLVAPTIGGLSESKVRSGVGVGLSLYRTNALAVRLEVALFGGDGHPNYVTAGRGLKF